MKDFTVIEGRASLLGLLKAHWEPALKGSRQAQHAFVTKDGETYIVKFYRKSRLTESEAIKLAMRISAYARALAKIGVPVVIPDLIAIFKSKDTYGVLTINGNIQMDSAVGLLLSRASYSAEVFKKILYGAMKPLITNQKILNDFWLTVGVDFKVDNFDMRGWYFDLVPTLIPDENERPVLKIHEMPPSEPDFPARYARFYDMRTIALVFLISSARIQPALWFHFWEILLSFAHEVYPKLEEYLENYPGSRFMKAAPQERHWVVNSLHAKDTYLIRFLACQLQTESILQECSDPMDNTRVSRIFALTRRGQINAIKKELHRWVDEVANKL